MKALFLIWLVESVNAFTCLDLISTHVCDWYWQVHKHVDDVTSVQCKEEQIGLKMKRLNYQVCCMFCEKNRKVKGVWLPRFGFTLFFIIEVYRSHMMQCYDVFYSHPGYTIAKVKLHFSNSLNSEFYVSLVAVMV